MPDKSKMEANTKTNAETELDNNADGQGKSTVKDLHMNKRVERKEDGRHLIYYSFSDKMPLPDNSQKDKGE